MMRRWLALLLLCTFSLVSVAHAAGPSRTQRAKLAQYQDAYTAAVRWSDFDSALAMVEPDGTPSPALGALELERYRQLQVSGYRERSVLVLPDGSVERRMEIAVINRNTMAERTLSVREHWRWDAQAKRWWQAAGLPDLWGGQ